MIPCSSCKRHVRPIDVACPFCGSALRSVSAPHAQVIVALALLGFACKTSEEGDGLDEATESTTAGTESESTESTESAGTTETSSTETESTETESTETSTESEGTETATDTTESEGGSFYAGPSFDFMPDHADPEELLDGPQYPMPEHGARHRLPE